MRQGAVSPAPGQGVRLRPAARDAPRAGGFRARAVRAAQCCRRRLVRALCGAGRRCGAAQAEKRRGGHRRAAAPRRNHGFHRLGRRLRHGAQGLRSRHDDAVRRRARPAGAAERVCRRRRSAGTADAAAPGGSCRGRGGGGRRAAFRGRPRPGRRGQRGGGARPRQGGRASDRRHRSGPAFRGPRPDPSRQAPDGRSGLRRRVDRDVHRRGRSQGDPDRRGDGLRQDGGLSRSRRGGADARRDGAGCDPVAGNRADASVPEAR